MKRFREIASQLFEPRRSEIFVSRNFALSQEKSPEHERQRISRNFRESTLKFREIFAKAPNEIWEDLKRLSKRFLGILEGVGGSGRGSREAFKLPKVAKSSQQLL